MDLFTTLSQAISDYRSTINSAIIHGSKDLIVCPCCDQGTRIYKRPVTSAMARDLIKAYRGHGTNDFHITSIATSGGGDFAKLVHWGLIKAVPSSVLNKDHKGKTNGFWYITVEGVAYLHKHLNIQHYMHLMNGKIVGSSGLMVSIIDSLADKFDYKELMGR